jgi:hypothetical protein
MTVEKTYSSHVACVLGCASPLALSPSISWADRPAIDVLSQVEEAARTDVNFNRNHVSRDNNAFDLLGVFPNLDLP